MKVRKICEQCGKEFETYNDLSKFCSRECFIKNQRGQNHPNWKGGKKIKKVCLYCTKEFWVYPCKKNIAKYCNKNCSYEAKKEMKGILNPQWNRIKTKCANCDKSLERIPYSIKKYRRSFCNLKCYGNYFHHHLANGVGAKKGEHRSPKFEFKKGIRHSPKTEFKKGDPYFNDRWEKNDYVFNFFKSRLFSNIPENQLTNLDKEIIKTRIKLFKLKRTNAE